MNEPTIAAPNSPAGTLSRLGDMRHALTPMQRQTIERLRWTADWMDSAFRIPGTKRTIGLDSLVGLLPGIGDTITGLVSAEFVRQAYLMGARKRTLLRMTRNVLVDMVLGSIPLLGDVFDFAFKANSKNVELLEKEFGVVTMGKTAE